MDDVRILSSNQMKELYPFYRDIEHIKYEGTFFINVFAYEWYTCKFGGAIVVFGAIYRENGFDNNLYEDAPLSVDDDTKDDVFIKFMVFNDTKTHTYHVSKQKHFDLRDHLADGVNHGFIVTFEKNSKGRIVPVHIGIGD